MNQDLRKLTSKHNPEHHNHSDRAFNVAVMVITCNGSHYIIAQLDSIRQQDYPIDAVHIWDDCSDDDTADIIRAYIDSYQLHSWFLHRQPHRWGWRRNARIGLYNMSCSYDFIVWCDQDDVWHPSKVGALISAVLAKSDCLIVYSGYRLINGEGKQLFSRPSFLRRRQHAKQLLTRCDDIRTIPPVMGCSMCISRRIIELVPQTFFDAISFDSPDWVLSRIALALGGLYYLDAPLFDRRIHMSNVTSDLSHLKPRYRLTYEELKESLNVMSIQKEALDDIIALNRIPCHTLWNNSLVHERMFLDARLAFVRQRLGVLDYLKVVIPFCGIKTSVRLLFKDVTARRQHIPINGA